MYVARRVSPRQTVKGPPFPPGPLPPSRGMRTGKKVSVTSHVQRPTSCRREPGAFGTLSTALVGVVSPHTSCARPGTVHRYPKKNQKKKLDPSDE